MWTAGLDLDNDQKFGARYSISASSGGKCTQAPQSCHPLAGVSASRKEVDGGDACREHSLSVRYISFTVHSDMNLVYQSTPVPFLNNLRFHTCNTGNGGSRDRAPPVFVSEK